MGSRGVGEVVKVGSGHPVAGWKGGGVARDMGAQSQVPKIARYRGGRARYVCAAIGFDPIRSGASRGPSGKV